MPYWEIVNQFLERSGRYDLGTPGDEDTTLASGEGGSAGRLINAGQRLLDLMVETPVSRRKLAVDVAVSGYRLIVRDLRYVDAVWIVDGDGRRLLKLMDWGKMRCKYALPLAQIDVGAPKYWTMGVPWSDAQQEDDVLFPDEDQFDPSCGESLDLQGTIILYPPADGNYTVQIVGRFWSKKFEEICDSTYWSERFPEVLVDAAIYRHEIELRNTQGANDIMAAIRTAIFRVDAEAVRQRVRGPVQLRG